jgi:hypothetical protein
MGRCCRIYLLELGMHAIEETTISRPTCFRNLLCGHSISYTLKTLVED